MKNPLLSLKDVTLSFGTNPLFVDLNLSIYPNDRICLVGKNGEGKSSLLKVISGEYELDDGERWRLPGIDVGYLPQQIDFETDMSIYDYVLSGLKNIDDINNSQYLADMVINPLQLNPQKKLSELSGGLIRRAFLAKALISAPDILLLDEPTNHLDISTIEWLEEFVQSYRGAIVCISHDRRFLKNASNKTFWLDRGSVKTNNKGYEDFERWSIEVLEQEQKEVERLERRLTEEEVWKQQGVTARRKRNQKRLHDLYSLRERMQSERAAQKVLLNKIKLDPLSATTSSKMVCEFHEVSKSYGENAILKDFSVRIMRGDKIGIIGANGAGKSTFLKILTGAEEPDSGRVKLGKTVNITYYDQKREQLDPNETLWKTLSPGGDFIQVGSSTMHVVAYLKNFLFDPKQARDKVSTLSGGQANRLLLAKNLANPGSVLILDEPTNDLDMDTLDMIQELLSDYNGTLLIVSHDRDFLDSLVTKTLYFAGDSIVEEFVGSYQSPKKKKIVAAPKKKKDSAEKTSTLEPAAKKMSYSMQRELSLMPEVIANLESEIADIEKLLTDASLYEKSPEKFNELCTKRQKLNDNLEATWIRWNELENL